jgi:hypothetical protein
MKKCGFRLVLGGVGIVSWIFWNIFVYSSPDQHPRISRREKEYIAASTGIKNAIVQVSQWVFYNIGGLY